MCEGRGRAEAAEGKRQGVGVGEGEERARRLCPSPSIDDAPADRTRPPGAQQPPSTLPFSDVDQQPLTGLISASSADRQTPARSQSHMTDQTASPLAHVLLQPRALHPTPASQLDAVSASPPAAAQLPATVDGAHMQPSLQASRSAFCRQPSPTRSQHVAPTAQPGHSTACGLSRCPPLIGQFGRRGQSGARSVPEPALRTSG